MGAQENLNMLLNLMSDQSTCRNCNQPIYWVTTKYKKKDGSGNYSKRPVNPDGIIHFETCPARQNQNSNQSAQRMPEDNFSNNQYGQPPF